MGFLIVCRHTVSQDVVEWEKSSVNLPVAGYVGPHCFAPNCAALGQSRFLAEMLHSLFETFDTWPVTKLRQEQQAQLCQGPQAQHEHTFCRIGIRWHTHEDTIFSESSTTQAAQTDNEGIRVLHRPHKKTFRKV